MSLRSTFTDDKPIRDLAIRKTESDESRDVELPLSQ